MVSLDYSRKRYPSSLDPECRVLCHMLLSYMTTWHINLQASFAKHSDVTQRVTSHGLKAGWHFSRWLVSQSPGLGDQSIVPSHRRIMLKLTVPGSTPFSLAAPADVE